MTHPQRWCGRCLARTGHEVPATLVAADATGLEWFECDGHDERDNVARTVRVGTVPIERWFSRLPRARA